MKVGLLPRRPREDRASAPCSTPARSWAPAATSSAAPMPPTVVPPFSLGHRRRPERPTASTSSWRRRSARWRAATRRSRPGYAGSSTRPGRPPHAGAGRSHAAGPGRGEGRGPRERQLGERHPRARRATRASWSTRASARATSSAGSERLEVAPEEVAGDRRHARPRRPYARHGRLRAPARHPAVHDRAHARRLRQATAGRARTCACTAPGGPSRSATCAWSRSSPSTTPPTRWAWRSWTSAPACAWAWRPTSAVPPPRSGTRWRVRPAHPRGEPRRAAPAHQRLPVVGEAADRLEPRPPLQPGRRPVRRRAPSPPAGRRDPRAPLQRVQSAGAGTKRRGRRPAARRAGRGIWRWRGRTSLPSGWTWRTCGSGRGPRSSFPLARGCGVRGGRCRRGPRP